MTLRRLVQEIRDTLVSTPDTVCLERANLVTQAYQLFEDEAPVLKRAKTFAHVLTHMTLDLSSNPVFAGNTSTAPRAWMLVPEFGFMEPPQIVIENENLAGILDGKLPPGWLEFWKERGFGGNAGIGHLAVDYDHAVHAGLESILKECSAVTTVFSPHQEMTRQAMFICLQAVISWAQRYAAAAEIETLRARNPLLRACYRRVATACWHVPAKPARTLFEALQSIILLHLAIFIEGQGLSVSIGGLDRILAPFIDNDFHSEQVTDLLSAFLLKINSISLFGRGSKTQAITVGGLNAAGRDQCNATTLCLLEAADRMRVGDPHIFLRWHDRIDSQVKELAVKMLASGVSLPLLVNDVPTVQGLVDAGVAEQDAWEFCVIGCNELGIPGKLMESATGLNGSIIYLDHLNQVLLEHPNLESVQSTVDILPLMEERMLSAAMRSRKRAQQRKSLLAERMPFPFTSALMADCVRDGKDFLEGMKYQLPGIYERSFTNAINALAAIEDLVFTSGHCTLTEFVQALRENYAGKQTLLIRIQQAPKWGTDNPLSDRWAVALIEMRERVLDQVDAHFASGKHVVCHVVRSLHYLTGRRISASPDGRLAGMPVADSIGADAGTVVRGPTGVLNSVVKLQASRYYRGGTNLNLTLPLATWDHPDMRDNLVAMIQTFFDKGGQELQIASLDIDVLSDAISHPQRYGDLLVRVAGFNTRFVDLSRIEQEELMRRAEQLERI
jgi:pyruvate-formate lyase